MSTEKDRDGKEGSEGAYKLGGKRLTPEWTQLVGEAALDIVVLGGNDGESQWGKGLRRRYNEVDFI